MNDQRRYPIGYVARRVGMTTHAIRAWEHRYGAIQPLRSGTNRRTYTDADIERLGLLHALSQAGHSIGTLAGYGDRELREIAQGLPADARAVLPTPQDTARDTMVAGHLEACREAVLRQDGDRLTYCLSDAWVGLSLPMLLEEVIAPLMRWIGDAWQAGTIRIVQEHLASVAVKSLLLRLRQSYRPVADARTILLATPAGETHEIGTLMASVAAAAEGWRSVYCGPNLPMAEIAHAARVHEAKVVGLGLAVRDERGRFVEEVRTLRDLLPAKAALVLGGAGACLHLPDLAHFDVHCFGSLVAFRSALQTF